MPRLLDQLAIVLGRAPEKRAPSPEAAAMHAAKRGKGMKKHELQAEIDEAAANHTWRNRRWAALIGINLLFTLSYWVDIQILEGSLTASRLLGFHLADVYSSFLVMLAQRHVAVNLVIGAVTVTLVWAFVGGRSFCAWVCPYHLVAEWAEMLHLALAKRGWVRDHPLHRGVRVAFWIGFAALALLTGHTLFLALNPIGVLSRAVVYGASLALLWVALLLAFEVVYARRAWCRYVCPIGLTYGVLGAKAPIRVTYDLESCAHEGECRKVCEVPHVLDLTIKGRAEETKLDVGPDCTRCGLCVDVCPTGALRYELKGVKRLL
ncbi:MAG: NapH/MauN family ferredoxin-type protein [Proteobacteria bacterium]|nr:MAG: NapH/MauN family ferredoxin-type protein [Pseudomonadota bacterium]